MIDERSLMYVFETRFESTHLAASQARDLLAGYLEANGIELDLAADIELAASELLSNAVDQGSGESIELESNLDDTAVYLTITNHRQTGTVPELPTEVAAGDGQLTERGRGLSIVQTLADGMWLHIGPTTTSVTCLHRRGVQRRSG